MKEIRDVYEALTSLDMAMRLAHIKGDFEYTEQVLSSLDKAYDSLLEIAVAIDKDLHDLILHMKNVNDDR